MRRPLLYFFLLLFLSACNESSEIGPSFIFLNVDKTLALDEGDQITMTTTLQDADRNPLEGFELTYFANGQELNGPIFRPTMAGNYALTARYNEIESQPVNVRVVNLEQDVEELILEYKGNPYLTTNPWSASGDFSFTAKIADQLFPLPTENIDLLLDGTPTTQLGAFLFDEAGTYTFQATLNSFTSNEVELEVRAEKDYDMVTIPIIFHDYGADMSNQLMAELLDTLNRSFSSTTLSLGRVLRGELNPNAVDCKIQFVLANDPPPDRSTNGAGLNVVPTPEGEFTPPTLEEFKALEADNNWDPSRYINIWMSPGYDFDFPSIRPNASGGGGGARGLAYSPYIEAGFSLPGLPTIFEDPRDPDPGSLSHAVLVRSGSVLGEHPDYLVNRVAYYLGLFDVMTFDCEFDGDYCVDTPAPNLSISIGPFNEATDCDGELFFMTNHMSIGRRYTHFTYDQRERLHFVLEHGIFRPRK
ncbi:MAG: M43 family zinc metalloprotease [Bacteroidota bacterium]